MKYYLPDFGETVDNAREILRGPCSHPRHDSATADDVAEHLYGQVDGDTKWPVTVVLVDDKRETRWSVALDYDPVFYAEPA